MKTARVVIGANYGDEGKGLTVDWLAGQARQTPVVVRFNGGAQAGHTVQTPDGDRHVFSHLGAGSFVGADTFLSRFFVVNPMLFRKEIESGTLAGLRSTPRLMIDARCPVTSPYEMIINQEMEKRRGGARHGSCGVGFGETIEREDESSRRISLTVADLGSERGLRRKLRALLNRAAERLGINNLPGYMHEPAIAEHFVEDCAYFMERAEICGMEKAASGRKVIFEGAQGLLLDMEGADFPHVTRSKTGLANVVELAEEARIPRLEVIYATRAYLTRHGAGPLAHETTAEQLGRIEDATNRPNDYQDALRFAPLDIDAFARRVCADVGFARDRLAVAFGLNVTCADQVGVDPDRLEGGEIRVIRDGREAVLDADELRASLTERLRPDFLLMTTGPTREGVSLLPQYRTVESTLTGFDRD